MSLITVVPFHSGDSAQAAAMLDWMADRCGQQERVCILAHEELTPADDIQRAASRAFTQVEHLPVSTCGNSWPMAANCYFACVAAAMRGREPWLWMEPDCVLVHPQGPAMLEADFRRSSPLALGSRIPAYFQKNGVWTQVGEMLCGVAIYNANLWDASPLLRSLRATQAAYAQAKAIPKAFDCYLATEILPHSADTHLIQHMGRSREFRREGKEIVCTYGPESRWPRVLASGTVLVHGNKDGSLIALLRDEMKIPAGRKTSTNATPAATVKLKTIPNAPSFEWGATAKLPPEEKPAVQPPKPAPASAQKPFAEHIEPPKPSPVAMTQSAAIAMLDTARKSVQHWPDCKARTFVLQEARGRHRVACECGACSAKLPEGVDWETAWNEDALAGAATARSETAGGTVLPVIEAAPAEPADSRANAEPAEALDVDAAPDKDADSIPPGGEVVTRDPHKVENVGSIPTPATISNGAKDSLPLDAQIEAMKAKLKELRLEKKVERLTRAPLPTTKLRYRIDMLAAHPEWEHLSTRQMEIKVQNLRKKEKALALKPVRRAALNSTKRLLTSAARSRKLELTALCKSGGKGGFARLRDIARKLGLREVNAISKDPLIILILEREFENPYEEFEKA